MVYDRPIGLRQLYADPTSGAEHYFVRYPADLQTRRHCDSAAHTIAILSGTMEIDGQLLIAGSFAHHPAGTPMQHGPAAGDECLFVIMFHGPFDVIPIEA